MARGEATHLLEETQLLAATRREAETTGEVATTHEEIKREETRHEAPAKSILET